MNTRKKIKNKITLYRENALSGVLQNPKYSRSLHAVILLGNAGVREKRVSEIKRKRKYERPE